MLLLPGCTSVISTYDHNGKLVKVEKATNFSRAMDGTNSKSQMLLIDGTFAAFECSASAGENCTPGISVKYASGKTAVINAKDNADFSGTPETIDKFFSGNISINADGIKSEK